MPTIEIDGQKIAVEDGTNLVEAAARLGIEIPHYCYHPGLSLSGNCRMCLVELDKVPKLQIACNTRATEGLVVHTQSERVKQARAAVLEFLLLNHPVDCPVCDQAGECKLQDYYMDYDRQLSRVTLGDKVKKSKAIDIGPLVMLDQERCILCTRCIRFLDEVTNSAELGIFERGDRSRISLFPGKRLDNRYSANVVDICPVGALTNKAFRFRARVWYLDHTPSVCPGCATGCNIEVHHRANEVFRVRPRYNDAVNGYWMCDEGRLVFRQHQGEGRLLAPLRRADGGWQELAWHEAIDHLAVRVQEIARRDGADAVAGVVGAQATCEEAFLFGRFLRDTVKGRLGGLARTAPDAYHDEFLIDGDCNPNAAGLRALGIDTESGEAMLRDAAAGKIKALVVFRADFADDDGRDTLDAVAQKVDLLAVIDTHHHATADAAEVVLPIASFAETDGTFVNRKGRVQRIRAAVQGPGRVRPGWDVLGELLSLTASEDSPSDAAAVFRGLAGAVPAFGGLSYETIGTAGVELAGVAS